ncbi:MAG: hypothetical protein KIS91_18700, partial [Anaerolineae bacterium]|nr:hypothetical protein [Anaerolineae bacterium]
MSTPVGAATTSTGEVKPCAHCLGKGVCLQGWANTRSCPSCLKQAGFDPEGRQTVACAACGGKGSVWIGPGSGDPGGSSVGATWEYYVYQASPAHDFSWLTLLGQQGWELVTTSPLSASNVAWV